jgi:hypothetical protein
VSPPQLGIRKAAVGKKLAFEGPDVLSHQFTITTRSFVKTEMLKAFSGCTYLWEIDKKLVGFVKLASLVIMEGLL